MSYPTFLDQVEQDIRDEREHSVVKHGLRAQDNLKLGDPNLLYNLGEEFGEVCSSLTYDQDHSKLRKELVQVAAMAMAWIQVIDNSQ